MGVLAIILAVLAGIALLRSSTAAAHLAGTDRIWQAVGVFFGAFAVYLWWIL